MSPGGLMHPQDSASVSWQREGVGDRSFHLLPVLLELEMAVPVMPSLLIHLILADTDTNRTPGAKDI